MFFDVHKGSPGQTGPAGPAGPQGEKGKQSVRNHIIRFIISLYRLLLIHNHCPPMLLLLFITGETGPEGPQGSQGPQGPQGMFLNI